MDNSELFERLKEIALSNPQGFTVRVPDLIPIKKGWSVALKETQDSFGDEGLRKVIEVALKTTMIVGGWNEKDGFWWDAVRVFEVHQEEEATEFGIQNEQLAIYAIHLGKVKWLQ